MLIRNFSVFVIMAVHKVKPKSTTIKNGDITRAIFAEIGIDIKISPIDG